MPISHFFISVLNLFCSRKFYINKAKFIHSADRGVNGVDKVDKVDKGDKGDKGDKQISLFHKIRSLIKHL